MNIILSRCNFGIVFLPNWYDSIFYKEKAKDKLVNLPLAVGTIMAERFKILKVLGKGSFGVVY